MLLRSILFSCFLFFLTGIATSQSQVFIGPMVAGQGSSSYIEHSLYQTLLISKPIFSYSGGVIVRHYNTYNPVLKLNSGIQTGIIYSGKGWKQEFLAVDGPTTRLDYMVLPIDGIIYWGDERRKLQILIGIYGEYLLSYSLPDELYAQAVTVEDYFTYDPDRDKKFGYGGKLGFSLFKTFGFGTLDFGAFMNYSVSNFINIERRANALPDGSNLFNFGIEITYLFQIR